jgi:hypothetical protein
MKGLRRNLAQAVDGAEPNPDLDVGSVPGATNAHGHRSPLYSCRLQRLADISFSSSKRSNCRGKGISAHAWHSPSLLAWAGIRINETVCVDP